MNAEGQFDGNPSVGRQALSKAVLLPAVALGIFTLCLSCADLSAKPVLVVFEAEMKRRPNFALHELAHAYRFRVLKDGFANAEIKAAYDWAKASGKYDRVERWSGPDKPVTHERAYAITDPQEYFAETTEAFFGTNDFFPFTRAELKQHDPGMFALLEMLWRSTPK